MPDLTQTLLPTIRSHRIPDLELGEGFIHPNYDGLSILNIPPTICRLFGVPEIGSGALAPDIPAALNIGPDPEEPLNVVMVLMDALALHRLQRWITDGTTPVWGSMIEGGIFAPLTSVFPSTTSCALPTIWSGLSPAQHGFVGYELWLKEYGTVTNMITHAPFNVPGSIERAGFDPENAIPDPTLGTRLTENGVATYAFQHTAIARSGMSRMFLRNVNVRGFSTGVEMWQNVRHLLETTPEPRNFIGVYWSQVDTLSHLYGPDDDRPKAEFEQFTTAFENHFLNRLNRAVKKKTAVILIADHGQVTTPKDEHYEADNHPNLMRRLSIRPTGENRAVYYYIRPGQTEAVREYIDRTFMGQFVQVDPVYAIDKGLFGPGEPSPLLRDRVGDLISLAQGPAYLWWGMNPNPLLGRHGGLTEEEMIVPFLAARL